METERSSLTDARRPVARPLLNAERIDKMKEDLGKTREQRRFIAQQMSQLLPTDEIEPQKYSKLCKPLF